MQMLHYTASDAYEPDTIYSADNSQTWFLNNSLYRNNIRVGKVDRVAEELFINVSMRTATSLWRYQEDLKDAFKHYKVVEVVAFTFPEAIDIFYSSIRRVTKKTVSYHDNKAFVQAYQTVQLYDKDCLKDYEELYKKSLDECNRVEIEQEEKRREREEKLKKCREESWKIAQKYIPKALKGKTWNDKLKNFFMKNSRNVPISIEEWKELHKINEAYEYGTNPWWGLNVPKWGYRDGRYQQLEEYPENPFIQLSYSVLQKIKGLPEYSDLLYLDEDCIKTSRGVTVDDSKKLIRGLLKRFINSSDKDKQKFIGLHVGSFVIREWNPEQRYLQIGCHRFYEQTLQEFADFITRKEKN